MGDCDTRDKLPGVEPSHGKDFRTNDDGLQEQGISLLSASTLLLLGRQNPFFSLKQMPICTIFSYRSARKTVRQLGCLLVYDPFFTIINVTPPSTCHPSHTQSQLQQPRHCLWPSDVYQVPEYRNPSTIPSYGQPMIIICRLDAEKKRIHTRHMNAHSHPDTSHVPSAICHLGAVLMVQYLPVTRCHPPVY